MENIVLNITIGERTKSEKFLDFYKEFGVTTALGTYGQGTASKETLNTLGIGSSDKCVLFSFMTFDQSKIFIKEIENKMSLRMIGAGLSVSIPISGIDGMNSLKGLVKNIDISKESEGYSMDTERQLLVIIANRGYTENVMEVARSVGAPGGTVVHARGTGIQNAEKFFGTLIGAEKEMIFIVSKFEKTKEIMKAIKEKVGENTACGAISFSLPICESSGIISD